MALRTLVSNASRRAGVRAFGAPAAVSDSPEIVVNSTGNGLRVGTISRGGETATITAWVDAGSRYETPQTNGVAQLFATSAMAGKAAEIAALGGMVSCNTSREFIVFEANVLKENVAAATKLLGEMVTSSPTDVAGAKATMLAELDATRLNPEQVMSEHLHDAAFLDTTMGMSTMGTPETVGALSANDVVAFAKNHVTAKRTVVAASGAVDANFAKMVEDSFKTISTSPGPMSMTKAHFTGSDKRMRFDSKKVAHIAIAFQGASHDSADAIPLALMGAYLGEIDAVNNTALLAKNATSWLKSDQAPNFALPGAEGPITLNIINESYKDSGLFGIYYTSFDNNIEEAMYFNLYNLLRLVHHATDEDVEFAKTQLKASLAAKLNTNSGLANDLAKSISTHGNAVSKKELFAAIDNVTTASFKAAADKVINDKDHALAAAGPIHELPDYNWIRRRSYWLRY